MKSLFPGHYLPAGSFKDAISSALIVFDTSVLLNFYEWAPKTRENSFETLRKVQDNCWLPFHVALEFHRNRPGRVERALKKHRDAIKTVTDGIEKIAQNVNAQDVFKESAETARLVNVLRDAGKALAIHATGALKELPQSSSEDPVSSFLAELFDGRVGKAPDQDAVNAINNDGKKRYESKHPPGVTDLSKEGFKYMDRGVTYSGMYGDLYIWMQILKHAPTLNSRKHLIFVTDERKKDWWAKSDDALPAPELANELALIAKGWKLWMLGSPDFFQQLSSALGQELSAADLAEIEEAAISSEFEVVHAGMASRAGHTVDTDVMRAYISWIFEWHDKANPSTPTHSITHDGSNIYVHAPHRAHRLVVHAVQPDESTVLQEILEEAKKFNNSAAEYQEPSSLIFDFTAWPDARKFRALSALKSPGMAKVFDGFRAAANIFAGSVIHPDIADVQSLKSV